MTDRRIEKLETLARRWQRREPESVVDIGAIDVSGLDPREQLECDQLLKLVQDNRLVWRRGRALTRAEADRLDALLSRVRYAKEGT